MISAKIGKLKNELSRYLRHVRSGEPVLILDRDRVIARIDPVRNPAALPDNEERRLEELYRNGTMRRPKAKWNEKRWKTWLATRPKLKPDVVKALLDEREDGR
ncbi:MAG: hypothetical protein HYY84_14405 [Deltaproteobacteria bacterium]|nr:hypothetical protein [Deltaproteobacteria bacterium]